METKEKIIELLKSEKNSGLDFDMLQDGIPLSDQGLDSLEKITLFFNIEETYGISVLDVEVDSVKTLMDIVTLVENKIA